MNYKLFNDVSPMMCGGKYEGEWEKLYSRSGGGVSEINIEEGDDDDDYAIELFFDTKYDNNSNITRPMESIREDMAEVENSSTFSFDFMGLNADVVCVAVRRQRLEASMDALKWALSNKNPFHSTTFVLLIHVYPETKYIPTLLGKFPVSQVNPEQTKNHMAHERYKRKQLLQEYIDVCSKSQVKVDTIEIESDNEAKAILDLIPILNIRKLVLGVTKSTARRLMKTKKGNGVSEEIVQKAEEFCDVKVICEGKEMSELTSMDFLSSPSSTGLSDNYRDTKSDKEDKHSLNDNVSCGCFGFR